MMQWKSFYIEKNGLYHLYCTANGVNEHGIFDMLGKLRTVSNDMQGIFDGWPVSVISIVASTPEKTEVCIDGDSFTVKASYTPCKGVLLKSVDCHNRTIPLHYIYKDKQDGEHQRMIFVVDSGRYTKQDVMNMFRRAG